MLKYNKY